MYVCHGVCVCIRSYVRIHVYLCIICTHTHIHSYKHQCSRPWPCTYPNWGYENSYSPICRAYHITHCRGYLACFWASKAHIHAYRHTYMPKVEGIWPAGSSSCESRSGSSESWPAQTPLDSNHPGLSSWSESGSESGTSGSSLCVYVYVCLYAPLAHFSFQTTSGHM
jgi:hypothetical protein